MFLFSDGFAIYFMFHPLITIDLIDKIIVCYKMADTYKTLFFCKMLLQEILINNSLTSIKWIPSIRVEEIRESHSRN